MVVSVPAHALIVPRWGAIPERISPTPFQTAFTRPGIWVECAHPLQAADIQVAAFYQPLALEGKLAYIAMAILRRADSAMDVHISAEWPRWPSTYEQTHAATFSQAKQIALTWIRAHRHLFT